MTHDEKVRRLETHGVGHLLWEFSIPAIAATVVNASHGVINRVFVGQTLGEVGIAAITVTFPIITIMLAIGMTIGIGSNTLLSIRLGEKKIDKAREIVGQALFLFILFGFVFAVFVLLFAEPLLHLFGTSERVMPHAKTYLLIMGCGAFFHEMSFGVNSFLRSEGKPHTAMLTTIIMVVLNIALDYLFLIVFRWDIWSAALATILAQIGSTAWVAWHYIRGNTLLRWHWKDIRWHSEHIRQVCILGMPAFLMQAVTCVIQALQLRQIMYYGEIYGEQHGYENGGDVAVGAFGIVFILVMFTIFPILGLNQGAQPIIGYNLGAKKYRRVAKAFHLSLIASVSFAAVCSAVLFVFPEYLFMPFVPTKNGENMLILSCRAARIFISLFPLGAMVMVVAGYYQAIGAAVKAIMLSMLRSAILLIPALLILPKYLGLDGVWVAFPVCDTISFIPVLILIGVELRRLKRCEKTQIIS